MSKTDKIHYIILVVCWKSRGFPECSVNKE